MKSVAVGKSGEQVKDDSWQIDIMTHTEHDWQWWLR